MVSWSASKDKVEKSCGNRPSNKTLRLCPVSALEPSMPLRALRKALIAFATFDSVTACRACAAEARAADRISSAPGRQDAQTKAAETPGSENRSRSNAALDARK